MQVAVDPSCHGAVSAHSCLFVFDTLNTLSSQVAVARLSSPKVQTPYHISSRIPTSRAHRHDPRRGRSGCADLPPGATARACSPRTSSAPPVEHTIIQASKYKQALSYKPNTNPCSHHTCQRALITPASAASCRVLPPRATENLSSKGRGRTHSLTLYTNSTASHHSLAGCPCGNTLTVITWLVSVLPAAVDGHVGGGLCGWEARIPRVAAIALADRATIVRIEEMAVRPPVIWAEGGAGKRTALGKRGVYTWVGKGQRMRKSDRPSHASMYPTNGVHVGLHPRYLHSMWRGPSVG